MIETSIHWGTIYFWGWDEPASGSTSFRGAMGKARIWNQARAFDQIVADVNNDLGPGTPGLIAEWRFDEEGDGQEVMNGAGGDHHGFLGLLADEDDHDPRRIGAK